MFKEIYDYRTMIVSLTKRDLIGRYKRSVLGFLWSFIDPLIQLAVYTFLFKIILPTNIPFFHICLFVALVPWLMISSCLTGGCMCVAGQQDMIKKIYFPREVLPIAFVSAQFINMLLSFIIVFVVLGASGYGFCGKALLLFPVVVIIEYILALGMTLFFSAVTVYFRDMQQILGALSLILMYASPIIYTLELVPEKYRPFYMINPITRVIVAYRDIFYYKQVPEFSNIILGLLESIIVLIIVLVVFRKLNKHFAEEL